MLVSMAGIRIEPTDFSTDREAIYAIRRTVFIIEQAVPEEIEIDGLDPVARHVLAYLDGNPVGTGRITPDGRIGRMAVLAECRAQRGRILEVGAGLGLVGLALVRYPDCALTWQEDCRL